MEIETLEANFYRDRAHLCHKLANAATDAKPLFRRLYVLATAYEEKAKVADRAGARATTELKTAGPAHIAAVD
jgi:hypothetical protein